jgi:hypothetical protein
MELMMTTEPPKFACTFDLSPRNDDVPFAARRITTVVLRLEGIDDAFLLSLDWNALEENLLRMNHIPDIIIDTHHITTQGLKGFYELILGGTMLVRVIQAQKLVLKHTEDRPGMYSKEWPQITGNTILSAPTCHKAGDISVQLTASQRAEWLLRHSAVEKDIYLEAQIEQARNKIKSADFDASRSFSTRISTSIQAVDLGDVSSEGRG